MKNTNEWLLNNSIHEGSLFILHINSHDTVEIIQGWRVLQRMSGAYYRYGWIKDKDDDEDDCDDDDDEDNDDDDDDDDRDDHKKKKYRMGGFFGFPYLYIPGTGEEIAIIFKSDRIITRQGFNVMYRVLQGELNFILVFHFCFVVITDKHSTAPHTPDRLPCVWFLKVVASEFEGITMKDKF